MKEIILHILTFSLTAAMQSVKALASTVDSSRQSDEGTNGYLRKVDGHASSRVRSITMKQVDS